MAKKTKESIIKSALKMCSSKSFDSIFFTDIANDVELKVPSVKYYFKNKDVLLDDMLEYVYQIFKEDCFITNLENQSSIADTLTVERFTDYIIQYIKFVISVDEM